MSIAIYSRKSKFTGKGESIENQIIKCKKFIEFKFETDANNIETYIDEGFSGKNENRPEYQKMLSKIKTGEITKVVIYQLNRLGRNARDIHNTMELCNNLGCVIYSSTEGFDSSTSFGRAVIGILASLAQLEREQLAERVKDNMYTLAKMGRWLGGQSPLGFDGTREYYIDENGKERSITELKKNNEELKIVKAIYDRYLQEKSISQVGKWSLQNNFKGKNKGNIDKSAILVILRNPVYVKSSQKVLDYFTDNNYEVCGKANGNGLLRYGKTENIVAVAKHKGIISDDEWLKVQKLLDSNADKAPALGKSNKALLTGLLKCKCGSNMQVRYGQKRKDGTKNHYYICNMKINSGGARCSCKNINGLLLEEKLIKFLKEYNRDKLITEIKSSQQLTKNIESALNTSKIESEIDNNKKSIDALLNKLKLVDDHDVTVIILDEIKKIKNRINELEDKKVNIVEKQADIALSEAELSDIIYRLETFNNTIDDLPFDFKKKYLNELLESVIYDGHTGLISVTFKLKKN